jgi:hypothetical protein
MKQKLKKAYAYALKKYRVCNRTQAFNRRYKNYDKSLFKKTLPVDVLKQYKEKWAVYGEKVETDTFHLCYNLSGKIEYNIVPENLFAAIIERKLNPHKELSFFSIKNVYDKWFRENDTFPKSYFHKIDNIFYDANMRIINNIAGYINDTTLLKFPLILKPSKDTNGGAGVSFVKDKNELLSRINDYSFLVCQEKIEQNEYLSEINDSSVNSVRVCLLKLRGGGYLKC